jgi:hypothetical protein
VWALSCPCWVASACQARPPQRAVAVGGPVASGLFCFFLGFFFALARPAVQPCMADALVVAWSVEARRGRETNARWVYSAVWRWRHRSAQAVAHREGRFTSYAVATCTRPRQIGGGSIDSPHRSLIITIISALSAARHFRI